MDSYILQVGGTAAALQTPIWRALLILIIPLVRLLLWLPLSSAQARNRL